MLSKVKSLKGYKLHSLDGELGKVKEFYFDDRHWTIRYLVADTGNWLPGRQVLVSPYALAGIRQEERQISVDLSKKQIEDSPSLSSDKPVSRQFEESYYGYYGYPVYWEGMLTWGYYPAIERDRNQWKASAQGGKAWDAHLRSTHAVTGYHVQALDGEVGHVEDFIIDDETWSIRYLVVDTQNWWPGKSVLVSPQWIERVSWPESKVFVNLSRDVVKRSPECRQDSPPSREYETELHLHYSRLGYWRADPTAKKHSD